MSHFMRRSAWYSVFFLSFLSFVNSAHASTGRLLTAEQETNLYSVICVTFAAAFVTAFVTLNHYWRSKLEDWTILFQSVSSVSIVAGASFAVGLLPVLRLVPISDAMFHLYVPSIVYAFLLLATSMWIRTMVNEQIPAFVQGHQGHLDVRNMRKSMRLYMRDRRIAKSKRAWAKKEALAKQCATDAKRKKLAQHTPRYGGR